MLWVHTVHLFSIVFAHAHAVVLVRHLQERHPERAVPGDVRAHPAGNNNNFAITFTVIY